jgi:hypothetical protein
MPVKGTCLAGIDQSLPFRLDLSLFIDLGLELRSEERRRDSQRELELGRALDVSKRFDRRYTGELRESKWTWRNENRSSAAGDDEVARCGPERTL